MDIPTFDITLTETTDQEADLNAGRYHTLEAVPILHADMLMAEQAAPRLGIDQAAQPLTLTTLWCWAALVRQAETTLKFPEFRAVVLSIDKAKAAEPVDPTGGPTDPPPISPLPVVSGSEVVQGIG